MRKRLLGVAVALTGIVGSVVVGGAVADAASLAKSGWWFRPQGTAGVVVLPPPPGVPEGGLMVSGTPEGATAIAAVRFETTEDESEPTLELAIVNEAGPSAVQACPVASDWAPAAAGRWDSKPLDNCGVAAVKGTKSADGKTMSFGLSAIENEEGVIDVALVPVPGSSFSITFAKPTSDSLKTTGGIGDSFSSDFDSSAALEAGDLDSGGSFDLDSSTMATEALTGGSFSTPLTTDTPLAAPVAAPTERQVSAPAANRALPVPASDKGKAIALLLALGAIAAGFFVSQQQTPAMRMLGSFAEGRRATASVVPTEPQVGGLGRFARLRQGPPPSL
jgi:hypothetical protein